MTSAAVSRTDPLPLYHQLKAALVSAIHDGGLQPGDRLPSESEMEQRYAVSRAVIRQALDQLVQEGVVERLQGKGTFVASPRIRHASRLISFTEDMRSQGLSPAHRVLVSEPVVAADDVAERLQLGEDRACWFLRRLHLADGRPVGTGASWLSLAHLGTSEVEMAEATMHLTSLYDLLQGRLGVSLGRGVETVAADLVDAELAALLGRKVGSPLLRVERVTYASDSRPIELTRIAFLGDRYEYRTAIYPP